jgi:hypothetical protein
LKIFVPAGEEDCEFVQLADSDQYALFGELTNGSPRRSPWLPFPVRLFTKGERRRSLCRSDAPWLFSGVLVLRGEAAETLGSFLEAHGEMLPLSCQEAALVAFNPVHIVDALDHAASAVTRLESGRIWRVDKYAFRKEAIMGLRAFKITSLQPSPVFVNEDFVEQWHAAGLKGLEFRQVWEG